MSVPFEQVTSFGDEPFGLEGSEEVHFLVESGGVLYIHRIVNEDIAVGSDFEGVVHFQVTMNLKVPIDTNVTV